MSCVATATSGPTRRASPAMTPIGPWTPWAGSSPRCRRRSRMSSNGSRWSCCGCASDEQARGERRRQAGTAVGSAVATGLKPWREIVTPHKDVASGRYQQAEFAADLWQVHLGEGTDEYRDPVEFFRRTYLTESLKGLLVGAVPPPRGSGRRSRRSVADQLRGRQDPLHARPVPPVLGVRAGGAGRNRLRAAGSAGSGARDGPGGWCWSATRFRRGTR